MLNKSVSVNSAFKYSALALVAGFASALSGALAGEIVDIRFGKTSATETRVVLDASGDVATAGDPVIGERSLTIAFDRSTSVKAPGLNGRGEGLVDTFAFSAANPPSLELRLRSASRIKSLFVIPPSATHRGHRLVIDLERGAPAPAPVAALPLAAPRYDTLAEVIEASVAKPSAPETTAPTLKPNAAPAIAVAGSPEKPVIVIDPGHGGTDPGATGPTGATEAGANLSAGLALAEALEKTGRYTVVLTRQKDHRLAHEERSRLARDARANLFISLHADAHSDNKVRGASVYTLSQEGSERSAREALAKGNYHVFDVDIAETNPEVGGILYNLAQRKTENESDRFAEILIGKLRGATPLLNNSHRRGNFKVLLAPDVPAVLLELAFISNKKDEANLGSETWRKRTVTAVAGAIDAYFADRREALHASNIPASPTR